MKRRAFHIVATGLILLVAAAATAQTPNPVDWYCGLCDLGPEGEEEIRTTVDLEAFYEVEACSWSPARYAETSVSFWTRSWHQFDGYSDPYEVTGWNVADAHFRSCQKTAVGSQVQGNGIPICTDRGYIADAVYRFQLEGDEIVWETPKSAGWPEWWVPAPGVWTATIGLHRGNDARSLEWSSTVTYLAVDTGRCAPSDLIFEDGFESGGTERW